MLKAHGLWPLHPAVWLQMNLVISIQNLLLLRDVCSVHVLYDVFDYYRDLVENKMAAAGYNHGLHTFLYIYKLFYIAKWFC